MTPPSSAPSAPDATVRHQRATVLRELEDWLELPMLVLGLVWLALLIADLLMLLPASVEPVLTGIWGVFVADYLLRLWLAEHRWHYVRHNWLTLLALAVPALRVLRFARLAPLLRATRAVRTVRAARVVTSFSRARRSLHALLGRRHGVGYVVVLTFVVVITGAAAMLAFEQEGPNGFDGYAHALWWTAMLVTTMGSEQWPVTVEGRALCLALAIYGFAVFGYITATIASWFVGRDRAAASDPDRDGRSAGSPGPAT